MSRVLIGVFLTFEKQQFKHMKKIISIIILCFFTSQLFGQKSTNSIMQEEDELVFKFVENMPEYPGGEREMDRFLKLNVNNEVGDSLNNEELKLRVKFVVTKTGAIKNIEFPKPAQDVYLVEAKRVIQLMPKWLPGKNNGVSVNCYYSIPIIFNKQIVNAIVAPISSSIVEQEPWFPKGNDGLKNYLAENNLYIDEGNSKDAAEIEFTINEKGFAENLIIKNAVTKKMADQIKALIKEMSEWAPARKNGVAIPWKQTLRLSLKE